MPEEKVISIFSVSQDNQREELYSVEWCKERFEQALYRVYQNDDRLFIFKLDEIFKGHVRWVTDPLSNVDKEAKLTCIENGLSAIDQLRESYESGHLQ
ncbi:hypothetical protein [Ammoniphilus sp. 3BR4]|uniref:hypothetical protein n=1 Tax=Ammoniphilus sp. 3BR4 TaxID=3158265 RepID=UPI003464F022